MILPVRRHEAGTAGDTSCHRSGRGTRSRSRKALDLLLRWKAEPANSATELLLVVQSNAAAEVSRVRGKHSLPLQLLPWAPSRAVPHEHGRDYLELMEEETGASGAMTRAYAEVQRNSNAVMTISYR